MVALYIRNHLYSVHKDFNMNDRVSFKRDICRIAQGCDGEYYDIYIMD